MSTRAFLFIVSMALLAQMAVPALSEAFPSLSEGWSALLAKRLQ
jgi:hypothetical protein